MHATISERWVIVASLLFFALLSLAASVTSEGFLEADGCTHYLYARLAFDEPHYLVNIWGRPVCTAVYAVPALLAERFGVRTMSLLLAVSVAGTAWAIAKRQGDERPALALVLTLAQPLVFLHSFSELTELPFALLLGVAFIAYQRKRWMYFAVLGSVLPLARPEGFGFLALAAIAMIAHRQWPHLIFLPIALAAWSFCGWCMYGAPTGAGLARHLPDALAWVTWLPDNWPYAGRSAYRPGSILHFTLLLPAVVSPLFMPGLLVGVSLTLKRAAAFLADHRDRCDSLIALIPLAILLGHSVLYATGRMASSGEIRYMLVVAPFWGILAARGWSWMCDYLRWSDRRTYQAAMLATVAPLVVNWFYQVLPLAHTDDWIKARDAAEWLEQTPRSGNYPRVFTAHPGVFYFLGISPTDAMQTVEWHTSNVTNPPRGTVMIWHRVYGTHNSDAQRVVPLSDVLGAGWVPLPVARIQTGTTAQPSDWLVFLSPLDINGRPTTR
jgi:hypothetical protein